MEIGFKDGSDYGAPIGRELELSLLRVVTANSDETYLNEDAIAIAEELDRAEQRGEVLTIPLMLNDGKVSVQYRVDSVLLKEKEYGWVATKR